MKSIRNITEATRKIQENIKEGQYYKYKGMWHKYMKALLNTFTDREISQELQLELIGVLSNLTPIDIGEKYIIFILKSNMGRLL